MNFVGPSASRPRGGPEEGGHVRDGGGATDFQEPGGQEGMRRNEIIVNVDLARGPHTGTVWTCDFSYDYVRINAEYRT